MPSLLFDLFDDERTPLHPKSENCDNCALRSFCPSVQEGHYSAFKLRQED